jgi:hypothetical protein
MGGNYRCQVHAGVPELAGDADDTGGNLTAGSLTNVQLTSKMHPKRYRFKMIWRMQSSFAYLVKELIKVGGSGTPWWMRQRAAAPTGAQLELSGQDIVLEQGIRSGLDEARDEPDYFPQQDPMPDEAKGQLVLPQQVPVQWPTRELGPPDDSLQQSIGDRVRSGIGLDQLGQVGQSGPAEEILGSFCTLGEAGR